MWILLSVLLVCLAGYSAAEEVLQCSFENGMCLSQMSGNDADWVLNSDETPSPNTGPSAAAQGSKYIYMEATDKRQGNTASAQMNTSSLQGAACLRFQYHMYGSSSGMGNLTVSASAGQIWSMTGNQGNTWHNVSLNMDLGSHDAVIWEATRGNSYESDIALDDIHIDSNYCSATDTQPTVPDAYLHSCGGEVNTMLLFQLLSREIMTKMVQLKEDLIPQIKAEVEIMGDNIIAKVQSENSKFKNELDELKSELADQGALWKENVTIVLKTEIAKQSEILRLYLGTEIGELATKFNDNITKSMHNDIYGQSIVLKNNVSAELTKAITEKGARLEGNITTNLERKFEAKTEMLKDNLTSAIKAEIGYHIGSLIGNLTAKLKTELAENSDQMQENVTTEINTALERQMILVKAAVASGVRQEITRQSAALKESLTTDLTIMIAGQGEMLKENITSDMRSEIKQQSKVLKIEIASQCARLEEDIAKHAVGCLNATSGVRVELLRQMDSSRSRLSTELRTEAGQQLRKLEIIKECTLTTAEQVRKVKGGIDQIQIAQNMTNEVCGPINNLERQPSCDALRQTYGHMESGVYSIFPDGQAPGLTVWCDVTGGQGWTVIQRRQDGSVNFNLTWAAYERGFGSVNGEFWIGNAALHRLTASRSYSLRVDLWDWEGAHRYALYRLFRVSSATDLYQLTIGNFTGDAGEAMIYNNNVQFSAWDRGPASWCARSRSGGWWWNSCSYARLNGRYMPSSSNPNSNQGVLWQQWRGWRYSLKKTEMKIRPQD